MNKTNHFGKVLRESGWVVVVGGQGQHLFLKILSNSSLSLVRVGFDFVLPLSQQEQEQQKQEQEQEPPPKSTRRKCTTDIKLGTKT